MSYWNVQKPFAQDKPIVGSVHFNAEKSVGVTATEVSLNEDNVKAVPAGLFLAKVAGIDRFLPRTQLKTAVTNAGGDVNLSVNIPQVFIPGDVLYKVEPQGLITLSNSWAANDTVRVILRQDSLGINVEYTHTQVGANLAALDDEIVTALNLATNPLSNYARFEVGGTGEIAIQSKGLDFELSVIATTAGDGAAAVTTQVSAVPVLVGTVASVDGPNSRLVLTAATAIDLAVGARIGTLTEEIYGLYNHSIDFTDRPRCVIKAIDRCDRIYAQALPYLDDQLVARFPNMKFVG